MSAHHTLRAEVGTVHRGAFDPTLAPVMTIASGDVVDVTTRSGNPDQIPPPSQASPSCPSIATCSRACQRAKDRIFPTGPIAVDGAIPGDELVVDVVDMRLAQDWGWNCFAPGMGALPEQFPDARCIHIVIDRAAATVTLPWGLKLKAAPFFGIIGVAPPPAVGRANSIVPGAFGGNIDNKHFGAGAAGHLPVFNPGGLLRSATVTPCKATAKSALPPSRPGSPARSASRLSRIPASHGPGRKNANPVSSPWRSIPRPRRRGGVRLARDDRAD